MGAPLGNQNGTKGKRWQDAIVKALARFESPDGTIKAGQALDRVAETVVLKALAGDKDAIAEIGNRLDGKAAQSVTVSGDEDQPLTIKSLVELVRPGDGSTGT